MLVAGEIGKLVVINAGIDLTTATELTITVWHPTSGVALTKKLSQNQIIVGTVDRPAEIERSDGALIETVFKAYQYLTFVTLETDFPIEGGYRTKLEGVFPGGRKYRSETAYQNVLA